MAITYDEFKNKNEFPNHEWPDNLKREIFICQNSTGILENSVGVYAGNNGQTYICFDIETDCLVEENKSDINDKEAIFLHYNTIDSIGFKAPSVWSSRINFPRNISHINPTLTSECVSLCLSRAGLESIYERFGLEGILERLRNWLRDAKTNSLTVDGWDPVPSIKVQKQAFAFYDIRSFQELPFNRNYFTGKNYLSGKGAIVRGGNAQYMVLYPEPFNMLPERISELYKKIKSSSERKGSTNSNIAFPWLFVWGDLHKPISDPFFSAWDTLGDLLEDIEKINLSEELVKTLGRLAISGCEFHDGVGGKVMVLVVGVPRPKPIAKSIYGLSLDDRARSLELKTYKITWSRHDNPFQNAHEITELLSMPYSTPDLFRYISGHDSLGKTTIIGYGAIGSSIGNYLVRGGVERLNVYDSDIFYPHNLSRHEGFVGQMGQPKVDHLNKLKEDIFIIPDLLEINGFNKNVNECTDSDLIKDIEGSNLIIDATANDTVRSRLVKLNKLVKIKIIRIELFFSGRIGIEYISGNDSNPNLIDLYYVLCSFSSKNEIVKKWLETEAAKSVADEEILLGFGCASATTVLPKYVVDQHVTSFMSTIVSKHDDEYSGVYVNLLSRTLMPERMEKIKIPKLHEIEQANNNSNWCIRITKDAKYFMESYSKSCKPNETGGYLYGGIDYFSKHIVITFVSSKPPGTNASRENIVLDKAGQTVEEKNVIKESYGKIILVGTWHSHPSSSAKMSQKDEETFSSHVKENNKYGIPTLMVIISQLEMIAYLN